MAHAHPPAAALAPIALATALLAGTSYWPMSYVLPAGAAIVVWKGAGVAMLALWAALRGHRPIAAVLACGAAGDVLLEIAGTTIGALAFIAGHVLATTLYRRVRRTGAEGLGLAVSAAVLSAAWALAGTSLTLVYAAALAGMTGAAFASRFPRRFVALGAALFALSDLLIFARGRWPIGAFWPSLLIWPLYFAGQALIAWGVATVADRPA